LKEAKYAEKCARVLSQVGILIAASKVCVHVDKAVCITGKCPCFTCKVYINVTWS